MCQLVHFLKLVTQNPSMRTFLNAVTAAQSSMPFLQTEKLRVLGQGIPFPHTTETSKFIIFMIYLKLPMQH